MLDTFTHTENIVMEMQLTVFVNIDEMILEILSSACNLQTKDDHVDLLLNRNIICVCA